MILITKYHRKGPTGWPRGRQSRISSISLSSGDEKNVFTTATSVRYQFPSLVHLRSSHLCNFFAIIWLSFQFSLSHTHSLSFYLFLSPSLSHLNIGLTLYISLSIDVSHSLFLFMSLSLSFYLCLSLSIYDSHFSLSFYPSIYAFLSMSPIISFLSLYLSLLDLFLSRYVSLPLSRYLCLSLYLYFPLNLLSLSFYQCLPFTLSIYVSPIISFRSLYLFLLDLFLSRYVSHSIFLSHGPAFYFLFSHLHRVQQISFTIHPSLSPHLQSPVFPPLSLSLLSFCCKRKERERESTFAVHQFLLRGGLLRPGDNNVKGIA